MALLPVPPTITPATPNPAAVPANPPPAPATPAANVAPSGSWPIIPGLLTLSWTYKAATDEVDVSADFLWWSITTVTGTLNQNKLSLADQIDLLEVVTGKLEFDAVFTQVAGGDARGLWVDGDLGVFGKNWTFKEQLLSW
jgi:hypothetical protein